MSYFFPLMEDSNMTKSHIKIWKEEFMSIFM